jgi:esterase/lipase superfamily enzyme
MSKQPAKWFSSRLERDVEVVRWGHFGTPVLVFPTAGGDAEEIERFHLVDACDELLEAGRIKIFSCDSVAGRAMLTGEGSDRHREWLQRQYLEFIRHELVPAIRADCQSPDAEVVVSGSSIGAYTSLACVCRYPDTFSAAICMSGTYDLRRFYDGPVGEDFLWSSPIHFVPDLEGEHLEALRKRFVVFATGQGPNEDIGESWNAANVLGRAGIPNRVDPWGTEWPHDWQTWRAMLPKYLDELLSEAAPPG